MIKISYSCDNFGSQYGSTLQGSHQLNVAWNDIVWAAISVGKLGFDDLMAYGQFSADEIRFRAYLIYAHLMQKAGGVSKSPLYESLDPTEKGYASYFIGMAASKLVGAFLLDVPWLVHVEKINFLHRLGLPGRSRPDLLGKNSKGQWLVFEAKGRTYGFSQSALDKAKAQTRQIRSISGLKPVLRVATESYFHPYLSIHIVDPGEFDNDAFDMKVDESMFFSSYYSTFSHLSQLSSRQEIVDYQHFDFIDNEDMGISVGISRLILESLEKGKLTRELASSIPSDIHKSRQDVRGTTKYYPDGIAITLDEKRWGPETMSVESSHR